MKTVMIAIASLMLVSLSSFADKVTITGSPVVLEEKEGVFVAPETFTASTSYNYVTIGGTNSVCYADAQPSLAKLTPKVVDVKIADKKIQWTCYNYDETYFTVSP